MGRSARSCLAIAVVTAGLVGAGHAWSLGSGLFLDDHSHWRNLQHSGWSYRQMVEASRLEVVGGVMELWFAEPVALRFYRPAAFVVMKVEYMVFGWRSWGMHWLGLLWHWGCALLVAYLAWLSLGRALWAGVAAGVFAVHPGHVLTVQWVACQTELMVTFFVLAAAVCYWRYAGWPRPMVGEGTEPIGSVRRGGGWGWLAACLAGYAAALGCRENAVAVPALLVVGAVLVGRGQWRRQGIAYGLLAGVTGVYLVLRYQALGGFSLPGRPYLVGWSDPDFFGFAAGKLAYSLLGLFAFVPILPIGGLIYLRSHPVVLWGGLAVVLVGWAGYLWVTRRHKGLWYWPVWIVLSLVPVLAVFCSPHHLYLPGVGMAVMVAAAAGFLAGEARAGRKSRRVAAVAVVAAVGVAEGSLCWAYGWVYRAGTSVEDLLVTEVVDYGPPIQDADALFFINMPLAGYYAIPAIEEATGCRGLRGYVLTFSPSVLRMDRGCRVERLSQRRLLVRVEDGGYFGGAMGGAIRQLAKDRRMPREGERIRYGPFEVRVVKAGPEGVQELVFEFAKPLDSPAYHFYLGSRLRLACALDMVEAGGAGD